MAGTAPGGHGGSLAAAAPLFASELYDVRNRLIATLQLPPPDNLTRAVLAMHAAAGLQHPADPAVRDPDRQAALLIANEIRRLREAALFWVSPQTTALCHAAAPGMPAFLPARGDLPAPCGLMYFAAPFGQYDPLPRLYVREDGSAEVERGGPVPVCAVSWGPWDYDGRWPGGGTWFTFYSRVMPDAAELAAQYGIPARDAARLRIPPLTMDNDLPCPADGRVPLPVPLEQAVRMPGSLFSWMHFVLCACKVMDSRATAVTAQPPARQVRKRSGKAGVRAPADAVRLVEIRPRRTRAQPAGQRANTTRSGPKVRFPVGPFWRNQWYPSVQAHRPILIGQYVKGPDGAPFRARKKVHVLREPGEAVRRTRPPDAGPQMEP